jgi:hypothetical protein
MRMPFGLKNAGMSFQQLMAVKDLLKINIVGVTHDLSCVRTTYT